MARKTIEVEAVREQANTFIANSAPDQTEARLGVAALLEAVLMRTGNYNGFSYLSSEFTGEARELKRNYDHTRRYYF